MSKRTWRTLAATVAAALVAGLGVGQFTTAPANGLAMVSTRSDGDVWVAKYNKRLTNLVNKRRTAHGLKAAKPVACAQKWAAKWSLRMTKTGKFAHSDMGKLLAKCNANYAAENIAMIWDGAKPADLVRMWMHSPGHRANILSKKSKLTGVSVRWDAKQGAWVAVQNFVRR
ncbi:MAG: CAP domain-containing protein [Nocardioidaceae bacterium]